MVQGKFKKQKLPDNVKIKSKKNKGVAFTRRHNAPVKIKKNKFNEAAKIKETLSKTVNRSVEEEIRHLSTDGQVNLSKSQEKVAKHHKTKAEEK
uniref:Uncharacterized protein n=1 Tax=Tabanus bromius TaxID=304241 RepID=A0A0K8TQ33_TABBR